jgi:hypothetical protein
MAKILRNIDQIIDTQGNELSVANPVEVPQQLESFRNKIINGNMRIDQRNAGSAVTASGNTTSFFYPVDRNKCYRHHSSTAEFTLQQVSDAPPNFDKSYKVTVTTPDASPSYLLVPFEQAIEGSNIYDLQLGTANAKTFTVSFWVKCSLSGELPVAVFNGPSITTYYVKNVTVTADTWHYKTITISGATSETFGSTNTTGLYLSIGAAGPVAYQATSEGVWSTGGNVKEFLSNSLNIFGTNGATLQITGVQLEEGTVATPFEHRPYGLELSLCQRYYEKSFNLNTVPANNTGETTVMYSHRQSGYGMAVPIVFKERKRIAGATTIVYNPYNTTANRAAWVASSNQAFTHSTVYSVTETGFFVLNFSSPVVSPDTTGNIIAFNWSADAEL